MAPVCRSRLTSYIHSAYSRPPLMVACLLSHSTGRPGTYHPGSLLFSYHAMPSPSVTALPATWPPHNSHFFSNLTTPTPTHAPTITDSSEHSHANYTSPRRCLIVRLANYSRRTCTIWLRRANGYMNKKCPN